MEIKAETKYVRISPYKAREVARLLQGKSAGEAMALVQFIPRKAARLFAKTLKSAIANAEENNQIGIEDLVVKQAVVGEGPTMKRFVSKARGMAGRINKRTSHLKVVLSTEK
ncbi:MAG: 50S ribosomal protein L22 [Lentisphaeria bacterium]